MLFLCRLGFELIFAGGAFEAPVLLLHQLSMDNLVVALNPPRQVGGFPCISDAPTQLTGFVHTSDAGELALGSGVEGGFNGFCEEGSGRFKPFVGVRTLVARVRRGGRTLGVGSSAILHMRVDPGAGRSVRGFRDRRAGGGRRKEETGALGRGGRVLRFGRQRGGRRRAKLETGLGDFFFPFFDLGFRDLGGGGAICYATTVAGVWHQAPRPPATAQPAGFVVLNLLSRPAGFAGC